MSRKPTPHIAITGGDFGGLEAARALAKADVRITLIDKHNHHLFQPLLYQVTTAALSPADISAWDDPRSDSDGQNGGRMLQWGWSYLTFQRHARLITHPWRSWQPGLPDRQIPPLPGCHCRLKKPQDSD